MATLGSGQIQAVGSYLGVGRETTWGTYATCTAGLDFFTFSLTKKKEGKILEEMVRNSSRTYMSRIQTSVMVDGEVGFYVRPQQEASNYLIQQAFGGTVSNATVSAGASYIHTLSIGDMVNNTNSASTAYQGLSLNARKGSSVDGKIFEYHGVRVNELTFSAEIDEALKASCAVMAKDSTTLSNDVATGLTYSDGGPLTFCNAVVAVELTTTSLGTTNFWHVQSAEFGIVNNLKADADSRRLGSCVLDVLPPGVANYKLTLNMRFDTITAYNYLMDATKLSAQLYFEGVTLPSSTLKEYIQFNFPAIYVNSGAEPEIGGPDEILKSALEFHILCDSATGYALQATMQNGTATY